MIAQKADCNLVLLIMTVKAVADTALQGKRTRAVRHLLLNYRTFILENQGIAAQERANGEPRRERMNDQISFQLAEE